MKNSSLTAIATAFLLLSLAVASLSNLAAANPSPQPPPKVTISSPTGNCNSSNVALSITVTLYGRFLLGSEFYLESIESLTYCVDRTSQQQSDVPITVTKVSSGSEPEDRYIGNAMLPNLSDGAHSITIQGKTTSPFNNTIYEFFYFTVDTIAPAIAIRSPEGKTYNSQYVELDYFVYEDSNVSYVLDGQPECKIAGNVTLTNLTKGHHCLTVYAFDAVRNEAYETIYFTTSEETEPEPTSQMSDSITIDIIVPIVTGFAVSIIIIAGIGLAYYDRSRRAKSNAVK